MSYDDYVKDDNFLKQYNEYQRKYAAQTPERDKVTLEITKRLISAQGGNGRILDIGCSTGNLLVHLKRAFPKAELVGGELAEKSLEAAKANPELRSVTLEKMDMLNISRRGEFDVVVSNAVTYLFDDAQFETASRSVQAALKPGGAWIDFDWFSPFLDQRVTITEVTPSHPKGLEIHVRTQQYSADVLKKVGFGTVTFEPFEIAIDLPFQGLQGDPISFTRMTDDAKRLQFRGVLYQPWCHLVAQR
jgi:SAM-dependent methyltransferase